MQSNVQELANKGNVLVIGNSGVGKSTLINAVLGENLITTGFGSEGTTKELKLYENDALPFRLIDTVGFEPSFIRRLQAIHSIQKWTRQGANGEDVNKQINVIWFCVDGTAAKLFPQTIDSLSQATRIWPHVPVLVVITKSYSIPDREKNIDMVRRAFSSQKHQKNLRQIIPVVAQLFTVNENAYAAPDGITELIDATHNLLPEGFQAAQQDISQYKLAMKRAMSQSIVFGAAISGTAVGAVPLPIPDALILGPVELGEVTAISKIYGIGDDEESRQYLETIVAAGTVSLAAKNALNALKAIPGVNIGAAALNAIVAGSIVAALGEGATYAFEQVYLGNKSIDDIDWLKTFMDSKLSNDFIMMVQQTIIEVSKNADPKEVLTVIIQKLFASDK